MIKILNKRNVIIGISCTLLLASIYIFSPFKFEYAQSHEKVWAHRVNTIEKLNYVQNFYHGIEIDVVFDSINNVLDVNHPPSKSINLSLDTFISSISDRDLNIWIDLKNLTETNSNQVLQILNEIVEKNSYDKQNILIESTNIKCLAIFKNSGFRTSFYLPQLVNLEQPNLFNPRIDSIKKLLAIHPTTGVSCHINAYEAVTLHLKQHTKYIWHIYKPYGPSIVQDLNNFKKVAKDSSVAAILVDVALPIGNR